MLKKLSLILCFFAFITTNTVQSHPVNGTMVDDGSGGGDALSGEFGVYVAAFAAIVTTNILGEVKRVVSEKDFARNLGLKVSDFWFGMVDGCRRPNHINEILSDQMTVDMRRILQESMAYGLRKQPYDNNQSQKFIPGYFGPDNQYYAWQNLFPSTLNKDLMAPGLVLYFPADKDDFINVAELVDNADRSSTARHHQLIQQLLEGLLPPEKKRKPLLGQSLDGLTRVFKSGVLRPAAYYGYDSESQKLKAVTNGVQVMRIINPADREGDMVDLLGTLVYVPDLNQREGVAVDIVNTKLLQKPVDMNYTDWLYTLPNRLRWLLSKKDRFFLSGSRKLDMQQFSGPITYKRKKSNEQEEGDSEERQQLMRERQERQALEQQLYALEARKDEELAMAYTENQQQLERLRRVLAEREAAERAGQYDSETGRRRFVRQAVQVSRIPVRRVVRALRRRDSSPELAVQESASPESPLRRIRSSIELATAMQEERVYTVERRRSPLPTITAAEVRVVRALSEPRTRSPSPVLGATRPLSPEAEGAASALSISPPLRGRGRFTVVQGVGSDVSPPGGDEVYAYEQAARFAAHRSETADECEALLQREIAESAERAEEYRRRSFEVQGQLASQQSRSTAAHMTPVYEMERTPSSRPPSPAYSICSGIGDEDPLTSVMVV
jgi:hypothetical protein